MAFNVLFEKKKIRRKNRGKKGFSNSGFQCSPEFDTRARLLEG